MVNQFQVRSMEGRPSHFLMHCRWNRDCEVANNHYIIYRSPGGLIKLLPSWELDAGWGRNSLGEKRIENRCGHRILPCKVYSHTEEDEDNSVKR